ncbi:MAG: hypothetical protein PVJ02_08090 [Gemmatimonadota bacterium]|jgi:hypothetical protein
MNLLSRGTRRIVSIWLSTLMLVLSVSVPLLDSGGLNHRQRWESEHESGICTPAHDHTICTQVGANLSIPARPIVVPPTLRMVGAPRSVVLSFAHRPGLALGNPTRAPPLV